MREGRKYSTDADTDCTLRKLVLHSRSISVFWTYLNYQAAEFSWKLLTAWAFFAPTIKNPRVGARVLQGW